MICPKCGSDNVSVQMVSETNLKSGHSFFWWLLIGWWWVPVKWIFFTGFALLLSLFAPKRYRTKTMHRSVCVCQNCGYHGASSKFLQTASPVQPTEKANVVQKPLPVQIGKCEVVGESFYKDDIQSLCKINKDYYWPKELLYQKFVEGDKVYKYEIIDTQAKLIPEPSNPYDKNAIRVEICGKMIGHIPKEQTQEVAELMNAEGFHVKATVAGGPFKEIIETEEKSLSYTSKDFDFSVRLKFFSSKNDAVSYEITEKTEPSSVLWKVFFVLAAAVLFCGTCALIASLVSASVLASVQPYVAHIVTGCVFFGLCAYATAGKAFD